MVAEDIIVKPIVTEKSNEDIANGKYYTHFSYLRQDGKSTFAH